MSAARIAALVGALTASGCEIGRPVVGERPASAPMPMDACWRTRCDEILEPREPVWRPGGALGASAATCSERSPRTLRVSELALQGDGLDLRCADVSLEADAPFSLDLRHVPLTGARITITSSAPGHLTLGGELTALELVVHGPIDVEVQGGALSRSRVTLEGAAPDRPASLASLGALVTDTVIDAPYGRVRAHESILSRVAARALELELEVAALTDGTLEASRLSLLGTTLRRADVGASSIVAAAGELEEVDVLRCDDIVLAAIEVRRSHVARCTGSILLDDADVDGSFVEADLRGSGRIRRAGLSGARVALEQSRVTLTAFCGVESLDVIDTSIECPSCEPAAPPEICGAPTTPQPFCPGFELSPCDGLPRPSVDPLPPEIAP